mmetsp:Transcript_24973/g.41773  ORF Transcript_24973/g.41773 Transcript_24973/m.41773 type:complete len:213 (-) Transcript_24973:647-1285(-)
MDVGSCHASMPTNSVVLHRRLAERQPGCNLRQVKSRHGRDTRRAFSTAYPDVQLDWDRNTSLRVYLSLKVKATVNPWESLQRLEGKSLQFCYAGLRKLARINATDFDKTGLDCGAVVRNKHKLEFPVYGPAIYIDFTPADILFQNKPSFTHVGRKTALCQVCVQLLPNLCQFAPTVHSANMPRASTLGRLQHAGESEWTLLLLYERLELALI